MPNNSKSEVMTKLIVKPEPSSTADKKSDSIPRSPNGSRSYSSKYADKSTEWAFAYQEQVEQNIQNSTRFSSFLGNLCCLFPAGCARLSAECGCLACAGSAVGACKDAHEACNPTVRTAKSGPGPA